MCFVTVRHEQGGAYMADMYGRLTGRAGVCLGTLGPGAMNLVTAIGDAYLDRAPLVALTGQADLERMHKESHQFIDLVELFRPITKWNARVTSPDIVPEVVRKAFKVAESEKPGATHLELPEDVMAADVDGQPLPRRRPVMPEPGARELLKAADSIRNAINPVALAGNGVVRAGAAPALREFCRATGIPVAETFMGKGVLDTPTPGARHGGAAVPRLRHGRLRGRRRRSSRSATTSSSTRPSTGTRGRDKQIIVIDSEPAEIDEYFTPEVELDRRHLPRPHPAGRGGPRRAPTQPAARPAARHGHRPASSRARTTELPDAAAAGAVGDPPGAGPRPGHPHLRRRAAQALDRPDVPGA